MFKFALVRHPYARACSHYWYRYRRNLHGMADRSVGLNEWIERAYGHRELPYYNNELMFAPCWHWLTDDCGRLLIDYVAYLESIDTHWPAILQGCGVDAELPVKNRASQGGVEQLQERSRKIIEAHFADDFEFLGYSSDPRPSVAE